MLVPDIRAAKEWGQRPTAVIMKDRWYGHRDHRFEKSGDPDEWVRWDYALVTALQIIEDGSDKNGLLHWQTEADWVDVQAVKKIDKFDSAVTRATSGKKYKGQPGEYFIPRIASRNERLGIPTFRDFQKSQQEEIRAKAKKDSGGGSKEVNGTIDE